LIDPFPGGIQASAALAGFACYRFVDPSDEADWFCLPGVLKKGGCEVVKQ